MSLMLEAYVVGRQGAVPLEPGSRYTGSDPRLAKMHRVLHTVNPLIVEGIQTMADELSLREYDPVRGFENHPCA